MDGVLDPIDEAATLEAVRDALAAGAPLEVIGAGTKRGLGRPIEAAQVLSAGQLQGISLYEPEELVLSAGPGTPIATIEALLAENRQRLEFEPPDFGPLWGGAADSGTLGGAIAANLAGPRRIKAGAARDHVLGIRAVSGRGEVFKSGGRVVKNVTGFDLSKLIAGSYGTLAVLTQVTIKVLPAPEAETTVLTFGNDAAAAVALMARAMGQPLDLSGVAHLPASAAQRSAVAAVAGAASGVTAFRLDGTEISVAARRLALAELIGSDRAFASAGSQHIAAAESAGLWREIRNVSPLLGAAGSQLWRLSVPPASGATVAGALAGAVPGEALLDWAGGLVWFATDAVPGAHAEAVRACLAPVGGHATLVRAASDVRTRVGVFQPQPEALAALTARTRQAFDPANILNPGRLYAPPAG